MTAARQRALEDAVAELDRVGRFLHALAYDELGPAAPSPARSPTTAVGSGPPPVSNASLESAESSQQETAQRSRDDGLVSHVIAFLHGFEDRLAGMKARVAALASPSHEGQVPDHLNATISEAEGADLGSEDESKGSRSHRPSQAGRMWTFGASFKGSVFALTPNEELTPLRRSMSVAYGRRRRSTILVGMPLLSLEPSVATPPALTIKTTRHTRVLRKPLEVKHALLEHQIPFIESVDDDSFDACVADSPAYRRGYSGLPTLTVVAVNIFARYTFMQTLRINVPRLIAFFNAVDRHHSARNPYHTSLHATNVLQAVHYHVTQPGAQKESLTDLQLCALLFSAAVMHVGHLGVHDAFLDVTGHPLTVIYPEGPMKAMSVAMALALLTRTEYNFLADAFGAAGQSLRSADESGVGDGEQAAQADQRSSQESATRVEASTREEFAFLVSHLVRLADETLHTELMAQLAFIQHKHYAGTDHVIFALAAVLRVASMSHSFKSSAVCTEWLARSAAEGFREGSAQLRWYCRANGFHLRSAPMVIDAAQISPHQQPPSMTDVRLVDFYGASFANFVRPLLTALPGYFTQRWIANLDANIAMLRDDAEELNAQIKKRAAELFNFERYYFSSGRHANALVDIEHPRDFFAVLESMIRGEANGAPAQSAATGPREPRRSLSRTTSSPDRRATSGLGGGGWHDALRGVAKLVAFVHKRLSGPEMRGRLSLAPLPADRALERLARFSMEWVELLLAAEATAPGTAFLALPNAPVPIAKYAAQAAHDKRGSKSRTVDAAPQKATVLDDLECMSLVRALDAFDAVDGAAEANAATAIKQIVVLLTQLCIDTTV